MSQDAQTVQYRLNAYLQEKAGQFTGTGMKGSASFDTLRTDFENMRKEIKKSAAAAGKQMSNAFVFCEQAFGNESQEILILGTELTINPLTAHFISRYEEMRDEFDE